MSKLNAAARDALSDSDFAYIDSKGGRHLPIHDAAHARNALARFSETTFESDAAKKKAKAKILAACRKFGVETSETSTKSDTSDLSYEHFTLDFGMKSHEEVTIDGEVGLLAKGYASLFGRKDQDGEHQVSGSFSDIDETWGAEKEPIIFYHHGLDSVLTTRRIGKALKWVVDKKGLYVEVFIPQIPSFKDSKAVARFKRLYQDIKTGKVNGFSVGGVVMKYGKALLRWSMSELTITATPSLREATFVLGAKAIKAVYGDVPPALYEPDRGGLSSMDAVKPPAPQQMPGMLSRDHFTQVMEYAQKDGDAAIHDHLLARPPEHHGEHSAKDCAVCTERRASMGIKATVINDGDWVQWDVAGQVLHGVVVSVHRSKVPGVASACVGTDENPAARIQWYSRKDGVFEPSELYIATHLTNLTKISSPPVGATPDPVEEDDERDEEDVPVEVDRKAEIAAALTAHPELLNGVRTILARIEADEKVGKRHSEATKAKVKRVLAGLKDLHQHLADTFDMKDDPTGALHTHTGS